MLIYQKRCITQSPTWHSSCQLTVSDFQQTAVLETTACLLIKVTPLIWFFVLCRTSTSGRARRSSAATSTQLDPSQRRRLGSELPQGAAIHRVPTELDEAITLEDADLEDMASTSSVLSYNSLWIHIRSSSFLCFIIVVVRKQQTEITHVVGHSACHAVHCVLAWALIEGKWSVLREMSYVCTYNPLLLIPPKFVMFMLSAIQWITRVDRSQIWRHERHTPS